ncbi:hypothetical protein [Cellvibrio japonicus]|uniref:Conserved domain protein n=1 Tax=Cellvibrio japonicus (strain Ueda107) TaxID=498211 RepID=B3PC66_CELJU|nr:hypothetical protein [Cellvibrio japonicus]ACE83065.1 conserved domain protein [Cellvibrio japonicus Ueda107]QEI13208.1 hypothetical protein FY117_13890 [Cellvibrio japonicus]QEI16782.1 hypothetical protein FY116_13895 [Cellvibrio japonicus]QEI20360.1 hypothetical protein FY115_13890 [Cellvibrio japonicus]
MIIANAQVRMAAQQEYQEQRLVRERLQLWAGPEPVPVAVPEPLPTESIQVDLSQAGALLARYRQVQTLDLSTELDSRSRLNLMILEATFDAISGRSLNMKDPSTLGEGAGPKLISVDTSLPLRALRSGAGLVYQRQERYEEREQLQFQAQGVIRTQDGREISFHVDLAMSREFVRESNLEIRMGDAVMVDPLVINFDGLGAQLSQTRFAFDLDSNGTEEQIAMLRPGSGFLALDRNGDGIINNGSELFGPTTGRGFAELAQFDEDGNQFIDEGDSIYHQLRIWMMNEDGSSQLMALGDMNVGAIFLGHVSSPFQLKDTNNNSLGEIANSGIYLKETGEVGVVQEVNLSV